jgi:hypothetical protein
MKMTIKMKVGVLFIFIIASLVVINYVSSNGIISELLYAYIGGETVYSEHFDQKKFNDVKVGDSYDVVIAQLKEPIGTHEYNDNDGMQVRVLDYSKSAPSNGHFRRRMIFLKSGKVIRKVKDIFID